MMWDMWLTPSKTNQAGHNFLIQYHSKNKVKLGLLKCYITPYSDNDVLDEQSELTLAGMDSLVP